MKNILNKIGAVSKPVIFGAALGIATVAVGVGVVTNLSSDGPKGVSGRVLSHYSADTASVGSGNSYDAYSKEVLEQQLASAQAARSGDNSLSYLGSVGKGKFAYNNEASAYQGGTVDPMAMNNAAYEGEAGAEAAMAPEVSGMMNQFNQTATAAIANAGKGAGQPGDKEEIKGELEKASASGTQLNKLSRGKMMGYGTGAGSSVKGGSGASRNMGTIQGYTGDRPAQQAVAPVNMPNTPKGNISGMQGAKHGRLGAMGGNGSRGSTSGNSGSGQAFFTSTTAELVSARKYSALGKGSVYSDAEKGFVEAGAAFDGSGDVDNGVQIDGSTPMIERAAALEREGSTIDGKVKGLNNAMNNLNAAQKESQELNNKYNGLVFAMLATLIGGLYAVTAVSWPWKWIPLVAGIAAIWLESIGLFSIANKIGELGYGFGENSFQKTMAWVLPTIGTAALGLALIPAVGNFIAKYITTKVLILAGAVAVFGALKAIIGF